MRHPAAIIVSILGALTLSGCFNETATLGAPPPVLLETTRFVVAAPHGAPSRTQLHDGILAVAEGQIQSVRAVLHLRGGRDSDAARRMLIGLGVDPARISVEPLRPGVTVTPTVVLSRTAAGTLPCANAIEPGIYGDPSPSLMSLARCQQNNNLAAMLVDPKDLAAPPRLAAGDGAYLVNGVKAWRADRAAALPTQDTTVGNLDSESGGGFGGATPATAVPTAVTAPVGGPATAPSTIGAAPAP